MKPKVFSTYGQFFDFDFEYEVEIFIDTFPIKTKNKELRILILMEPNIVSNISNIVISRCGEFDYIFTYDSEILKKCENSFLFEFGTNWVDFNSYNYPIKKFSISTVCGYKQISKNHLLRKKIWYNQNKIKIPTEFYISQHGGVENLNNNKILKDSKLPLFESMFHICIENNSQDYYFTEKIIDCLLCKSIPVYVGCTNIEKYFHKEGIIVVNNFKELIEVSNSLTEKDYINRIEFIEKNFNKALNWVDYSKRVELKIKELKELKK